MRSRFCKRKQLNQARKLEVTETFLNTNLAEQGAKSAHRISFDNIGAFQALVGELSKNIKHIEKSLGVNISIKGNTVSIFGESPGSEIAEKLLKQLYPLAKDGYPIHPVDLDQGVRLLLSNPEAKLKDILRETVFTSPGKRPITPKTPNQKTYIEAIQTHDMVFGIGPAGTGKTVPCYGNGNGFFRQKRIQEDYSSTPRRRGWGTLGVSSGGSLRKSESIFKAFVRCAS